MSNFTPDAVSCLAGPDWLSTRRQAAFHRYAGAQPPSEGDEIWRYTRISELDLSRYLPASPAPTITGAADLVSTDEFPIVASTDPYFDELNQAFAAPLVLRVPAGRVIDAPVVIEHSAEAGQASFLHLVVDAGADSECTIIERFRSGDDIAAAVFPVVDIHAGPAARVRYLAINELGRSTTLIAHQRTVGERDSTTALGTVSLGGSYARFRTDVRAVGVGAATEQITLYFADGDQMHDFRTIQEHVAPKTTSDLLFKGAVNDTAHSVYTGLIRIGPEAKGSVAFQTNRNLTLSHGAWAESVPNLEIETNDVKCSHASTVGPIDADQLFYLESRGVPPLAAHRLILAGYFGEVFGRLRAPVDVVAQLVDRIAAKLERVNVADQPVASGARR